MVVDMFSAIWIARNYERPTPLLQCHADAPRAAVSHNNIRTPQQFSKVGFGHNSNGGGTVWPITKCCCLDDDGRVRGKSSDSVKCFNDTVHRGRMRAETREDQ
jgi:hypothetical protein